LPNKVFPIATLDIHALLGLVRDMLRSDGLEHGPRRLSVALNC